jgi:aldose 1-epimerase
MLTLTSRASSIVVAPEYGAGLSGWMLGGTPILRDPHAMGCFPLLPYGNRIAQRRFHWRGSDYQLEPNFGDHPHTIHGVGWQRAWMVEEVGPRSVTLSFNHRPDTSWPFAFSAEIRYSLSEAALTVTIQMTNRHSDAAPAGIGLHPHFPKTNDPALRFKASGVWENGFDLLPSRHRPARGAWLYTQPRSVAELRLDNCFTDWDGTADFRCGPASVRIEASEVFRQLQVFTPSWADFFCVEPVSHIPDALNHATLPADQTMHVLQPNETLGGSVRFTPIG